MSFLKKIPVLSILLLIAFGPSFAQSAKEYIRQANAKFDNLQLADARDLYDKAYKLDSNNALVAFRLGQCDFNLHYKYEALDDFVRAYELDSNVSPEITRYLARTYQLDYMFDSAIVYFNKYLKLHEHDSAIVAKTTKRIEECEHAIIHVNNPIPCRITNLGDEINSRYDDYSPVVSADEQILMFTSRKKPPKGGKISTFDNEYFEDIYVSERLEEKWSYNLNIGDHINTKRHDACIGLSADGTKLLVYKSNKYTKGDIYFSDFKDNEWTEPEKMSSSTINTDHQEPSACINQEETVLYFSSDRPGGYGGLDIYKSELLPNGQWGPPENLGSDINTEFDEDAPFIHADNITLTFASNGHNSMGGYDIFTSDYDNSSKTWSTPWNIGHPVNTPDDDIYLSWTRDDSKAYFSSNRKDGQGGQDIYLLELDQTAQEGLVVIKGKVLDNDSRLPLPSLIKITADHNGKKEVIAVFNTTQNGKYLFVLPQNKEFGISCTVDGFVYYSNTINVPVTSGFREIEKDILMSPISEGASIVLKNIFFDYNKADLREESLPELNNIIDYLKDHKNLGIEISGHTDSIGSYEYNQ